jgi:hypothetical protein
MHYSFTFLEVCFSQTCRPNYCGKHGKKNYSTLPLQLRPRTQGLSSWDRKDPGRRWSRDLLKSSRFLINYLGFLYDNHTKCKL